MAIELDTSEFIKSIEELESRVDKAQLKFVRTSAAEVERVAKSSMRDTAINPSVSYGKRGHHPSQAYNPPAIDYGTMLQSITHDVIEQSGQPVGRVGSTLNNPPYPKYLEYGTSKMKPRPWLNAALIKCRSFFQQAANVILGGAIK